jgi:hypothetical protein
MTYHLKSRFSRLLEQGLLNGKEMAKTLGICETTVHDGRDAVCCAASFVIAAANFYMSRSGMSQ